jgi:hypothetical protein
MVNHSSSLPTQQSIRLLINNSDAVSKYIKNVSIMSKATAYAYSRRLASFENFLSTAFGTLAVDKLIRRIKEGDQDVFDVLNEYMVSYWSDTRFDRHRGISCHGVGREVKIARRIWTLCTVPFCLICFAC